MSNFRIDGLSQFSSNDGDFVSSLDKNSFDNALLGQSSSYITQQAAKQGQEMLAHSKRASEEINEAALKQIAGYVVNQKNKMIMESRGKAFKSAAELTKEISF